MAELKDNAIERITGSDIISVSLTQRRYITKVRKLAEKYPEKVQIIAENKDGSIFAHLPLKALKLSIITPRLAGVDEKPEQEEEEP